jgi:hypothetical protein
MLVVTDAAHGVQMAQRPKPRWVTSHWVLLRLIDLMRHINDDLAPTIGAHLV